MWKYCEIYCVIITIYIYIYIRKKKYKRKNKKKKKTIAIVPLGTVANVQKKKKKRRRRQSASRKGHCRWTVKNAVWTVRKQYRDIGAFRYKKKNKFYLYIH